MVTQAVEEVEKVIDEYWKFVKKQMQRRLKTASNESSFYLLMQLDIFAIGFKKIHNKYNVRFYGITWGCWFVEKSLILPLKQ